MLDEMTPEEVIDAFSGNLSFGTGGLRGVMGLGTNRMNRYTIERVTHGLAKTILAQEFPKSVGIAFDTRHNSSEFAQIVCDALSAYGIAVSIFDKPVPTPLLSFAIRYLKLGWGVVITASHNPQEYNGYKVYNNKGVQLTDKMAMEITKAIDAFEYFSPFPEGQHGPVERISKDVEQAYKEQIVSFTNKISDTPEFPFVYSALHGTGASVIPYVLEELGFSAICIQQEPDGTFGGMQTPNPEEPTVYEKAIETAEKHGAKLLCATDPDCDRVGVMIKTTNSFKMLNGNQIGALLIDYLAQTRGVSIGDTVITTIVSGLLGELVSKSYGLEFRRLLTGFKYIGEYAEGLPENKSFFFGYEESYGFLAGDWARDKDAVIATALIAQMAAYYEKKNMTLLDRLDELSNRFGFCLEALHSYSVPMSKQKEIMTKLRNGVTLSGLIGFEDFLTGLDGLPPADVIKLYFDDGVWAAIRPSGTEPKIKLYIGTCAETLEIARASLESITDNVLPLLEE